MQPIRAIVFDLYGTLYDVHSIVDRCDQLYPGRGSALSLLWRQKQLEYTWLRSLMGRHADFEQVTTDALHFCCQQLRLDLDAGRQAVLLDQYLRLAPFPEVPDMLARLRQLGLPLAILSNGSRHSIESLLTNSGLGAAFDHVISIDEVRVFKPHPQVYQLPVEHLGLAPEAILFVSCNAWDASGARSFGYPVCWLDRGVQPFDELGQQPNFTIPNLQQLEALVARLRG
jgi:2-haloacid dehalogenase